MTMRAMEVCDGSPFRIPQLLHCTEQGERERMYVFVLGSAGLPEQQGEGEVRKEKSWLSQCLPAGTMQQSLGGSESFHREGFKQTS